MIVIMTGPQATDQPHNAPEDVARRLHKKGVYTYSIGVGPNASPDNLLGIAYKADYATRVNYRNLNAAATYLAPAVSKGKTS